MEVSTRDEGSGTAKKGWATANGPSSRASKRATSRRSRHIDRSSHAVILRSEDVRGIRECAGAGGYFPLFLSAPSSGTSLPDDPENSSRPSDRVIVLALAVGVPFFVR